MDIKDYSAANNSIKVSDDRKAGLRSELSAGLGKRRRSVRLFRRCAAACLTVVCLSALLVPFVTRGINNNADSPQSADERIPWNGNKSSAESDDKPGDGYGVSDSCAGDNDIYINLADAPLSTQPDGVKSRLSEVEMLPTVLEAVFSSIPEEYSAVNDFFSAVFTEDWSSFYVDGKRYANAGAASALSLSAFRGKFSEEICADKCSASDLCGRQAYLFENTVNGDYYALYKIDDISFILTAENIEMQDFIQLLVNIFDRQSRLLSPCFQ